jgi:hypothetical protein
VIAIALAFTVLPHSRLTMIFPRLCGGLHSPKKIRAFSHEWKLSSSWTLQRVW